MKKININSIISIRRGLRPESKLLRLNFKFNYIFSLFFMSLFFSTLSESQILDSMFVYKNDDVIKIDSIQYKKAWGLDLIASENGFGLGGFFRYQYSKNFTGMISVTFSEGKDGREMEYVDYWGYTYTPNKITRVMMIPITAAIQYRIFDEDILETFRPYVNGGVGPVILMTTPFVKEFFSSLKYAQAKYTYGGFLGVGADFGIEKKNLMGVNVRYYYTPYPAGIEIMEGNPKKSFGGIYITLNFGIMY
jgi:hypothetical protein